MSTTKNDTRTADELAEAVREGDTTITPDQIAEARRREEFAALQAEATQRAEQRAAESAREQALDQLRRDIDSRPIDTAHIAELAGAATAALDTFVKALQDREQFIAAAVTRCRDLGIVEMQADYRVIDSSGIGWRRQDSGPLLIVGDRRLTSRYPNAAIDRLVSDVRVARGVKEVTPGANRKPANLPPVHEQLDALDYTPPPPEPEVTIEYLVGRSTRAGERETLPASSAAHRVERGLARRV